MSRSISTRCVLAFIFTFYAGVSGRAQTITATLGGVVTDTSGAVAPKAKVTATNTSTGFSRSDVSSDTGEYRIALLPVGDYTVTAELAGFQKQVRKVTLQIGQVATLDFVMPVGEVAQRAVVEEAEATLEPTRTAVSSVITQKQIEFLPVNGRQFIDFALLAPGVTIGDTTSGSTDVLIEPVTKLSFAGQNIHFNFIAIDGADNISTASGTQKTTPSQEAVQEFRVVNTVYSAEFGRAVGGIVNIITKSGTNEFHGSAYDFFRNNRLDAKGILASPDPSTCKVPGDVTSGGCSLLSILRQNQFGATLGGPIQKDRTFFFANYEGQRRGESPLYNSVILQNIQKINLAKQTFYNLPPENLNVLRVSNSDNGLIKLDFNLSKRHSLSTRYFVNDGRLTNYSPLNDGFDLPSGWRNNAFRDQSVVGNLVSTFSSTFFNELRGQFARRSFDFPSTSSQPHLEVANTFTVGVNRGNPEFYKDSRFELVDNVTLVRGRHTIGFGGNFNYVRTTESFPLFFPFEATFANLQDFLGTNATGRPSPFVIFFERFQAPNFNEPTLNTSVYTAGRIPDAVRNQASGVLSHTYNGMFIQDKVHFTNRLTMNFGLRYEFETWPSAALDNDMDNVDPRIGFAYNAGTKWNLVIRGGGGIFHGIIPSPLLMCQIPSCGGSGPYPGRAQKEDALNATTGLSAFGSDPASMQKAIAAMIGPGVTTGVYPSPALTAVIVRFARDHQAPYGFQTSLSFEVEPIAGTTFSTTYLHVRGVHLGSFSNVNQPDPSGKLESGAPDFASLRPFAFCRPCFLDRFVSVPGIRTFPFGIYLEADSRWNSVYDGLLINVNRRLRKHVSFGLSYTLSKTFDDGPNPSFVLIPVVSTNFRQERALSSDDARHRFVGNAIFAGPTSGNYLLRDYLLSFIVTLESPHRFTKFAGFDANGDIFGVNDRVGLDGRNTFVGDNFRTVDVRLSRAFQLREKLRMEFIAEAFNLLNKVNIRFFNTVYGDSVFHPEGTPLIDPVLGPIPTFKEGALNPAYGTPRSIFNPRQLQFAVRFTF
jgi:Carboxypeptidase regulatory-like domain